MPSLLIVDDHREMRLLIRRIVRSVSEDVTECGDGSQALASYITHRPDWVLMDVEMAEMDGLRATKAITAQFPGAKIIIVTQHDDVDTRNAAMFAGATGFVSKDNLTGLLTLLRQPDRSAAVPPEGD